MFKEAGIFFMNLFIIPFLYAVVHFGYPAGTMNFLQRHKMPQESEEISFAVNGKNKKNNQQQQENHPPIVKITAPKNNSIYEWNTTVPYTISVSDQEDGESQFQEISSNEVFLEVKYVPDASKAATHLKQTGKSDAPGLTVIKNSNCFNCHTTNTKLIGPSFYEISKRYPPTKSNTELLIKHIRDGSTGVWGNVSMPTHPELTREETEAIVQWILKNGTQQGLTYYRGIEGSFRLKPPVASKPNGAFVLTASYTDHGLKDKPKQNLTGQDMIIIRGK